MLKHSTNREVYVPKVEEIQKELRRVESLEYFL